MSTMKRCFTAIAITGLLAACASNTVKAPDATAEIGPASGSQVSGTASFTRTADGVHLALKASGLTPGEHGIHVHEVGDCSAADATSAKGHFNPTNKAHGGHDGEHHAGDIPNLTADSNGNADYAVDLPGLEIGSGDSNIIGRALIIHAAPDDYKTQPAGNSGKRVACGVIKAAGAGGY
jgi:superoxide dismutase, Cu-Zn family